MINASWNVGGTSNGLADSVGLMVYEGTQVLLDLVCDGTHLFKELKESCLRAFQLFTGPAVCEELCRGLFTMGRLPNQGLSKSIIILISCCICHYHILSDIFISFHPHHNLTGGCDQNTDFAWQQRIIRVCLVFFLFPRLLA